MTNTFDDVPEFTVRMARGGFAGAFESEPPNIDRGVMDDGKLDVPRLVEAINAGEVPDEIIHQLQEAIEKARQLPMNRFKDFKRHRRHFNAHNTDLREALQHIEAGDAGKLDQLLDRTTMGKDDLTTLAAELQKKCLSLHGILEGRLARFLPAQASAPGSDDTTPSTVPGAPPARQATEAMRAKQRTASLVAAIEHENEWNASASQKRKSKAADEATATQLFQEGRGNDVDAACAAGAEWDELHRRHMHKVSRSRYVQLSLRRIQQRKDQ